MRRSRLPSSHRILTTSVAVPVLIIASAVLPPPDLPMPNSPTVLADSGNDPGDKPWD